MYPIIDELAKILIFKKESRGEEGGTALKMTTVIRNGECTVDSE